MVDWFWVQVSRDIPYSALQFMTFEMLKRQHLDAQMPGRRKKRVKGIADDLWMGAVCLFLSLLLSLSQSCCSTDQTVQRVYGCKATGSLSRTGCLFKIIGCSWTCSSKLCLVTGNSWQVQWHALWQHRWMLQKQESWLKTQQEIQCILACRQPYRKSG